MGKHILTYEEFFCDYNFIDESNISTMEFINLLMAE